MSKARYLIKNMGILMISNFSSKILVFLLVPLYTSVLSTAEYGTYDLSVSTVTLLFPILSCNIADATMRFLMDKRLEKDGVAFVGIQFILLSILEFGIVMYVLSRTKAFISIHGLEAYIFLYYVSFVLNQFLIQFAKGIERVTDMGIAGVISTLVTIIGNILLLLVFKKGLLGFFCASILAQFASVLYLTFRIRIWQYIDIHKRSYGLQRDMLAYSVPLIVTVVGWWVNSTADKYTVTFFLGVSANGLLSVSYKIPQIINTLQTMFIQAWQISAIKEYGEKDTAEFYGTTFKVVNLLMCISCACLIFFTRPLAYILFANDFYNAWKYVPFLLISSVMNCAGGLLGPILSAKKDSTAMMRSALVGILSNVVLNIILVKLIGIQGATIATVISSYLIYAVRKSTVKAEIKIEGYSVVLFTWGLLLVQGFLESYLSNYLAEAAVLIILLIINWKDLKHVMSLVKNVIRG